MRISMLNGNIQMCVDTKFNKYEVPVFCINEPLSYAQETIAEKNLNFDYNDEALQVKIRSVKYPTEDLVVPTKSSATVAEFKRQMRQQKSIPDSEGIRFFYNGREMIDDKTLGNYSYAVGTIIQAMIR
jgi:Ubiquitin family